MINYNNFIIYYCFIINHTKFLGSKMEFNIYFKYQTYYEYYNH